MDMIKFNRKTYVQKAADAPKKAVVLESMNVKDLVALHNEAAAKLHREGVKGFSSRSVALERTWDIFTEAAKPKGERKQAGEAAVQKKRGRVPGPLKFVFPYKGAVKTVREDGLRGRALAMLKKGVLFADVESMVVEEDKKSGKPGTNTKRRAYRLIRAMHRHAGYGLRVDKENRIFAHQDA